MESRERISAEGVASAFFCVLTKGVAFPSPFLSISNRTTLLGARSYALFSGSYVLDLIFCALYFLFLGVDTICSETNATVIFYSSSCNK